MFRSVPQDYQMSSSDAMKSIKFEKLLGFVAAPRSSESSSAHPYPYKEGMSGNSSSIGFHYANSVYYTTVVVLGEEDDLNDLTEDDVWGSGHEQSAAPEDLYSLDHQETKAMACSDRSKWELSSDRVQRDFWPDDDDDVPAASSSANRRTNNVSVVSTMNMILNIESKEKTIALCKDPYGHGLNDIHKRSFSSSCSFVTSSDQELITYGDFTISSPVNIEDYDDDDDDYRVPNLNVSDASISVTASHAMRSNGPRSAPMDIADPKLIYLKLNYGDDDDGDDTAILMIGSDAESDEDTEEDVDARRFNGNGSSNRGNNLRVVPPHELVAKQEAKNGRVSMTSSVTEGAGRTLKGREVCKVRDAVWKQTGFPG
jgi:hypothetical protein